MKQLLLIGLIFLTGCGILPEKYDPIEYDLYVDMYIATRNAGRACGTEALEPSWNEVVKLTERIEVFSTYQKSDESKNAAVLVQDLTGKFKLDGSKSYCKNYTDIMLLGIGRSMTLLAGRVRR